MAITTNSFTIQPLPSEGIEFYASLYSADLTGCEILKALVAGKSIFLTKIMVRTATAMAITIGSGESTGAVATTHIGPVAMDAASGFLPWNAPDGMGMRCTSGTDLTIDSDTSGATWIYVEGKVCSDSLK